MNCHRFRICLFYHSWSWTCITSAHPRRTARSAKTIQRGDETAVHFCGDPCIDLFTLFLGWICFSTRKKTKVSWKSHFLTCFQCFHLTSIGLRPSISLAVKSLAFVCNDLQKNARLGGIRGVMEDLAILIIIGSPTA